MNCTVRYSTFKNKPKMDETPSDAHTRRQANEGPYIMRCEERTGGGGSQRDFEIIVLRTNRGVIPKAFFMLGLSLPRIVAVVHEANMNKVVTP